MPKTKIICTLGPASNSETTIRKMAMAGMDVARLNFSHGSHEEHKKRIEIIRKISTKYNYQVKILQDLEGFRIRIGKLKGHKPIELRKKKIIFLVQGDILGTGNLIPFDYEGRLDVIKPGQLIYIDDGNIALKIINVDSKKLKTEIVIGGWLKENKGVNIPGADLEFSSLTEKDRADLDFGIKNKVDYIAQSFVSNKDDILDIKNIVKDKLPDCKIIAKIENRDALKNIDEIISVSDGIMVARGDLGVSVPIYEIPVLQKEIIKKCNEKKKFVITATQMLESMTEHMWPTRAETTDVANAIIDGTDFVMLSGETAAGKYPVETVEMMNKIVNYTEANIQKVHKVTPHSSLDFNE